MPATTYTGNKFLDLVLRGQTWTPPTAIYVSLHTEDPGLDGSAGEVDTGDWPSYARQDATGGGAITAGFSAADEKATSNLLVMLYPQQDGAAPVTVTHFAIWDHATAGNCLLTGALTAAKTINPTDELIIRAGDLDAGVT